MFAGVRERVLVRRLFGIVEKCDHGRSGACECESTCQSGIMQKRLDALSMVKIAYRLPAE